MSVNWPLHELRTLVKLDLDKVPVAPGVSYPMAGVLSFGRGLFVREDVDGGTTSYRTYYRLAPDHIVMSQLFGWEGALAVCDAHFAGRFVSPMFPTFRADPSRLDPGFVRWWLKRPAVWQSLGNKASGMGDRRRSLNPEALLSELIPLPPLAEQRRIVARLDTLAAKIEEARGLRTAASDEFAVAMAAIATSVIRDGTAGLPHRRFGEFSPHVTSGPRSWSARCQTPGKMRFYRAQDIRADGTVEPTHGAYLDPPDTNQGATARTQPGDLLIVITGATVGRVGLFEPSHEPGYVSQHVAICRLPPDCLNARYAQWWLRSRDGVGQLLGQRYGQGKPGLNLSNIRAISLPVPALAVQSALVSRLDAMESRLREAVSSVRAARSMLDALLASVLGRAFAGVL